MPFLGHSGWIIHSPKKILKGCLNKGNKDTFKVAFSKSLHSLQSVTEASVLCMINDQFLGGDVLRRHLSHLASPPSISPYQLHDGCLRFFFFSDVSIFNS